MPPDDATTLRDVNLAAADAHRLLQDPALWPVIRHIRDQAVHAAIYGPDERDRTQARMLVVAIDSLASELQSRIDTAIGMAEAARRAPIFE